MRRLNWKIWLVLPAVLWIAAPSHAAEPRLAISGYDPVAYFTDGKPVRGQSAFEYVWHDARWQFASAADRASFVKDPDHYAPQYDGFCAVGVGYENGHKDTVDPTAWAIVGGKLYLTHSQHWLGVFRENTAANIALADKNWPTVKEQNMVFDGYPNVQKKPDILPATPAPAARAGGG
jgi:hypothetical protein